MRRAACVILALLLLTSPAAAAGAEGGASAPALDVAAPSAILMEKTTGEVLYEKNADERRPPASVTKVMTMLLIAEAVDGGEITLSDEVTASAEAASMGGSQVWLEEGERMTVSDMLKCIAVVSANDCAVAMAEYISGSEAAFVERMNARAAELGMENTHFTNCTGLFDDEEHYTSARDIAVMSRELMLHGWIRDYTTIWMDSIRDGEFGLSNTNKLVRHYEGCTGLKTGFTSEAMYCLSATAEREGMELIAVIMHAESIESRNRDASTLLNYGFAGYELCALRPDGALPPVRVSLGEALSGLELAVDANVWRRVGNDIYIGLDRPVRIYEAEAGAEETPHLARVNLPAMLSVHEGGASVLFDTRGMMQVETSAPATTESDGWTAEPAPGGGTVFTKYSSTPGSILISYE